VRRLVSAQVKQYVSLILLVIVVATAWTVMAYIWRDRTLRLLGMQGTDALFSAARGERILSISVAPERKLGTLEFRFRCLIERDPEAVSITVGRVETTAELLEACPPVSDRLDYFATMGADEYVVIHEVVPANKGEMRLVFVDFGRIYASFFEAEYSNESITTFAFLLNETDHLVGYFEGYSEIMVMRGSLGKVLTRGELLDLVRVQAGEDVVEYAAEPGEDGLSLDDLPPWAQITFRDAEPNQVYGVTTVVREGKIEEERLVFAIETYVDGNWFEDASGYWVIKTRRL
jgi:hypothetical protein